MSPLEKAREDTRLAYAEADKPRSKVTLEMRAKLPESVLNVLDGAVLGPACDANWDANDTNNEGKLAPEKLGPASL